MCIKLVKDDCHIYAPSVGRVVSWTILQNAVCLLERFLSFSNYIGWTICKMLSVCWDNFCHFPITSCSHEERYQVLPTGLVLEMRLGCVFTECRSCSRKPDLACSNVEHFYYIKSSIHCIYLRKLPLKTPRRQLGILTEWQLKPCMHNLEL